MYSLSCLHIINDNTKSLFMHCMYRVLVAVPEVVAVQRKGTGSTCHHRPACAIRDGRPRDGVLQRTSTIVLKSTAITC